MNKIKQFFIIFFFGLTVFSLPTFAAVELNSSNVSSLCSTSDKVLYCWFQNITSLAPDSFINHSDIEYIYLSNNAITTLSSDMFSGLNSLKGIYLESNPITNIDSGTFSGMPNLEYLNLSYTQLSTISSTMFNGVSSNLSSVNLSNSQISTIESGALKNLTGYLDLTYNQLTGISSSMFDGAYNINMLMLYNNQISTIESGAFKDCNNVSYLGLNNNNLTTVANGIFTSNLTKLSSLALNGNQIASIESGAFNLLTALEYLWVDNNRIDSTTIDGSTMILFNSLQPDWKTTQLIYGCTNLLSSNYKASATSDDGSCDSNIILTPSNVSQVCNISSSSCNLGGKGITRIEPNTFANYVNLETLYINTMPKIFSGTFNGLSNLRYLDMSYGVGSSFEAGSFNGLPSLETLIIIWGGTLGTPAKNIPFGTFSGLSNLRTLILRDQDISELRAGIFNGLSSLNTLNLYNNGIDSIEPGTFSGLSSLTNLNLSSNSFTTLSVGTFDGLTASPFIDLRYTCLDTENETLTNYLSSFSFNADTRYVCVKIAYSKDKRNTGSFVGSLFFTGGFASDRNQLITDNPNIGNYSHTWTSNGIYGFDYSVLTNTNWKIWGKSYAPRLLTGEVTWITDPIQESFSPIITALESEGIRSNFDELSSSNVSSFSGLHFEKRININDASTAVGSITFNSDLDLSDSNTQTFLQNIGSKFIVSSGFIGLDFRGISDAVTLKGAPAIIKFYGLDQLGFNGATTSDDINAKLKAFDDNGNELDKASLIPVGGTYLGACGVGETECYTFTVGVNHFTQYKIVTTSTTTPTSASHGGGGGSSVSKDDCQNGDLSSSYYDGICGNKVSVLTGVVITTGAIGIDGRPIADDLIDAYKWAYKNQITTINSLSGARIQDLLTRGEMAKMIVNYAINTLGKKLDTSKKASFIDLQLQTTEMKSYIKKAYQLGLMGVNVNRFNPNGFVTRGEFATVLSRLLYGEQVSGGGIYYYDKPIALLNEKGIIKNTTPLLQEARGYVMLMLMRSSQ